MREEKVYQIIGWILLPISVLLMAYGILMILLMPNLPFLLMDTILAGMVIYLFTSLNFLRKNILKNEPAKRHTRLWIRISGYLTAFFVFFLLSGSVTVLSNQNMLKPAIDEALSMAQARVGNGLTVSYAQFHELIIAFLWAALVYALLLLLHLLMSFLFLRRYRYLFEFEN
jgi:uncharacterized membrane protein